MFRILEIKTAVGPFLMNLRGLTHSIRYERTVHNFNDTDADTFY